MSEAALGATAVLLPLLPLLPPAASRPGPAPAAAARSAAQTTAEIVGETVVDGSEGRLRELSVWSPALGREVGVRVLLPTGYDEPAGAGRTWPVLWLLHGVGDDHRSWSERIDLLATIGDAPIVVAMPEAGQNAAAGWYSDWITGPAWETAHLRDLLPAVEARFGVGGTRERRVVAGLSMGGFGTMSYAARHPDLWVAAASFSGAVCTNCYDAAGALVFEALAPYVGTPGPDVWGPYLTHEVNWRGHDPVDLASNLRPLGWLAVRTGNGVPCPGDNPPSAALEAGVYPMNLALHDRLSRLGIEHQWLDRGCGTHEWHHWQADLAAVLSGFLTVLDDPPPPPAAFDHRFVEDRQQVFGWTFSVADRSDLAFTDLTAVSATGLTATGAGTLTVTTPPDHPGRWLVTTPDGSTAVLAEPDGRLTFTVALGSDPVTVELRRAPATSGNAAPEQPGAGDGTNQPPSPSTAAAPGPRRTAPGARLASTGAGMPVLAALVLLACGLAARPRRRR